MARLVSTLSRWPRLGTGDPSASVTGWDFAPARLAFEPWATWHVMQVVPFISMVVSKWLRW
jgi:hypothetical protein